MTNDDLARQFALGLANTGVEGGYGSVSCSTAGDYPSMGVSQWEGLDGGRGDVLLGYIDGGDRFAGRTYSDIDDASDLGDLSALLDSPQGQEAQNMIMASDCMDMYIYAISRVPGLTDEKCKLYALMWCPTSHNTVRVFLRNRIDRVDVNCLEDLRDIFANEYYIAADVGEMYAEGYRNRANIIYDYIADLDI